MKRLDTKNCTVKEIEEQLAVRSMDDSLDASVASILQKIRQEGDAAVRACTKQFDGIDTDRLFVETGRLKEAKERIRTEQPELYEALQLAIARVRNYHEKQKTAGWWMHEEGAILGQLVRPLARVGIYVPGGTAAYPSTVLMNVIPAQVAGVPEIVIATPPAAQNAASEVVMATAAMLGVEQIYLAGGAQAIAALAYGTESCPRVDKITGPGNRYVAAAKRSVYGTVDIDMIAGPSEILVIADETAVPSVVAADLLSQAEHDPNARVILLSPDEDLLDRVEAETMRQLAQLDRKEIAEQAVAQGGYLIRTADLTEAVTVSNAIAPEHLSLQIRNPFDFVPLVANAGSIFVGPWTPEALGDYLAGPNHTLPTAGTARFSSPLSVQDFCKKSSVSYFTKEAFEKLSDPVQRLARTEGLEAHARAVAIRKEASDESLS